MMRKSFLELGWEEKEFLPKGWMQRESRGDPSSKRENKKITYITPTGNKIATRERVLACMKEQGCSEEEIDKFKENCSDIKYQTDPYLPQGWKRGLANVGKGKTVPRWLCPRGKLYNSRATAIRSLLVEGKYTSEEIEDLRLGLCTEGFSNQDLPAKWVRKWGKASRSWMWVSPDFTVIRNQKELVMHLEDTLKLAKGGQEMEELVEVLMRNPLINLDKSQASKVKGDFDFDWREADPSDMLPDGWKVIANT